MNLLPKYFVLDFVGETLFSSYSLNNKEDVINTIIEKNIDNPLVFLGYDVTKEFLKGDY